MLRMRERCLRGGAVIRGIHVWRPTERGDSRENLDKLFVFNEREGI